MKVFLKHLSLFLLPIVVVAIGLEVVLRSVPNDYSLKRHYLDSHSREVEVLALGSSHVYYGIDPIYLKKNGYNAAYVSQTFFYDYEILKKYDGRWDNLKYIVLAVDYFSLHDNLSESAENWRVKNYNIYWGFGENNKLRGRFEVTSPPRVIASKLAGRSPITSTELGRGIATTLVSDSEFSEAARVTIKRHTSDYKYFDENLRILKAIIEFAKQRGIKLLLYTSPADPTYYKNLDQQQLNRTLSVLHELDNVGYINLLEDSTFTRGDFWDPDHLNESGAKKLTLMIDKLLGF